MKEKRFKSINEVSELLGINSHVIRYWDTKFEGLSTRNSPKSQRFFNIENIKKLQKLKLTLYNHGKHSNSLDLAKRIINDQNKDIKTNNNEVRGEKYISNDCNHIIKNLIEIRNNLKKIL